MKIKKIKWIITGAALTSAVAIAAVGCTPKDPDPTPIATPEATAMIEATPETTPEVSPEATPETPAEPIVYTDEEVAAAKEVLETYCTDENIEAETIEYDANYNTENKIRFFVTPKDSKDKVEFLLSREDATSEWQMIVNNNQ